MISLSAAQWNGWRPQIRRAEVLPGQGITIVQKEGGQVVSASLAAGWRHPWFTTLKYETTASGRARWVAYVKAGFVNGVAPVYSVPAKDAPAFTLARMALAGKSTPASDALVEVPLYEEPAMELSWLAIGSDGQPGIEPLPFFATLGVGSAPKAETLDSALSGGAQNVGDAPVKGRRLLRACDIVLIKPRSGLTSQLTIGDAATQGFDVQQTLGIASPPAGAKLRLVALSQWAAAAAPTQSTFDGTYEESTDDETLIATVYLVSQPDAEDGSDPDAGWTPYVKHASFWNMRWSQPAWHNENDPNAPLTFNTGLAGGIANGIFNSELATVNDAYNAAWNVLQDNTLAGYFWDI